PDVDRDGWGDAQAEPVLACAAPGLAWVRGAGDCDDTRRGVRPGAAEICNGLDDDCDGLADDADPEGPSLTHPSIRRFLLDEDGDGATVGDELLRCVAPAGGIASDDPARSAHGDCDDHDATRAPHHVDLACD